MERARPVGSRFVRHHIQFPMSEELPRRVRFSTLFRRAKKGTSSWRSSPRWVSASRSAPASADA